MATNEEVSAACSVYLWAAAAHQKLTQRCDLSSKEGCRGGGGAGVLSQMCWNEVPLHLIVVLFNVTQICALQGPGVNVSISYPSEEKIKIAADTIIMPAPGSTAKLHWARSACDGWVDHFMWALEHSNNPWKAWWHAGDPCVVFSFTSEATDMQNLACYRCMAAYWCMSTAVWFYVGQKVQSCRCRRHKAIRKRERMQTAASACLWRALKQGALNITLILIIRFLFFSCY